EVRRMNQFRPVDRPAVRLTLNSQPSTKDHKPSTINHQRYFATIAVAQKSSSDAGTSSFQQNPIIWSMRRRGSVQRTHIIRQIIKIVSSVKQPGAGRKLGPSQPPKKITTPSPAEKKVLENSARKKNENRIPEYSVWKPLTSSDSASGRSNGDRFTSASAHV